MSDQPVPETLLKRRRDTAKTKEERDSVRKEIKKVSRGLLRGWTRLARASSNAVFTNDYNHIPKLINGPTGCDDYTQSNDTIFRE